MLGKAISHYPAFCRCTAFRKAERDPAQRDKILARLGEGGMGVVYKAEDTKLKRIVALKFPPRQIAASDEERERFRIEAQATAQKPFRAALNHLDAVPTSP